MITTPSPASKIGLGCVTFGREIDEGNAFAMMDYAAAHGVGFFDTAAAYGGGASETIVGKWFAQRGGRGQITLATKILPPYAPATIEAAVDASLRRLGLTGVDVLFLHRWDATAESESTLRALDRLVQSGRVRQLGASNFTAEQLERTLALQAQGGFARFGILQNIHNLAVRGIDGATLDLAARHAIELVSYSPLGAGFLTGKHEGGVQPGSRFDLIPGHQNVYFNDLARQRLARLKAVSTRAGIPMTTLALAWALHQPAITTVLVGGRTIAHLDQAFHAQAFAAIDWLRALEPE